VSSGESGGVVTKPRYDGMFRNMLKFHIKKANDEQVNMGENIFERWGMYLAVHFDVKLIVLAWAL